MMFVKYTTPSTTLCSYNVYPKNLYTKCGDTPFYALENEIRDFFLTRKKTVAVTDGAHPHVTTSTVCPASKREKNRVNLKSTYYIDIRKINRE